MEQQYTSHHHHMMNSALHSASMNSGLNMGHNSGLGVTGLGAPQTVDSDPALAPSLGPSLTMFDPTGGSSTSLFESEPPPSYLQHVQKQQRTGGLMHSKLNGVNGSLENVPLANSLANPTVPTDITGMTGLTQSQTAGPPLSPISESSSGMGHNLSGPNTRSVSVSNESVAGDSGVFEAATHKRWAHIHCRHHRNWTLFHCSCCHRLT